MTIQASAQAIINMTNEQAMPFPASVEIQSKALEIQGRFEWFYADEQIPTFEQLVRVRMQDGTEADDWYQFGGSRCGWVHTNPYQWRELV